MRKRYKKKMRAIAVVLLGMYTATGGGYTLTDSDEAGGPVFAWDDISTTGTVVPFAGIDDAQVSLSLPFTFTYFGVPHTSVSACTNGFVQFGGFSTSALNVAMPSTVPPNGIVAVFWDDLFLSGFTVRSETLGVAPSRRFVVSWIGVSQFGTTNSLTFQVALYETTNVIRMQYQSIAAANATATIGIENEAGDTALQYVLDGAPAPNAPYDGLAIECVPAPTAPPFQPPPLSDSDGGPDFTCGSAAGATGALAAVALALLALALAQR